MKKFIQNLPKAELHLHIEGTLEPKLMFKLAKKNNIDIPYKNVGEIQEAYNFTSLQSFLDVYYQGMNVLITVSDFYDLTMAYLQKCYEQKIVHVEIFFDPQAHTKRGIPFETVVIGISQALDDGKRKYGISSFLIMSFLRHLTQADAIETLKTSLSYKEKIKAVGLDSSEVGNPPSKFKNVFQYAKNEGYKIVAHAGEEGDCSYIWEAINLLHVDRIDHGIRCEDDEKLVKYLKRTQIPLTICPLSNTKLRVVKEMKYHNVIRLLKKGLFVTINSDDPAYFGGYLNENFEALISNLHPSKEEIIHLVENSFYASFLDEEEISKQILNLHKFISLTKKDE